MDKMTDARAVEVLAAMREDGGVVADADYVAAIDRAVARLREPAEAQAQGGGEVYGYEHDGRYWSRDGATPWVIHHAVPLYTAPPSAPVGVEEIEAVLHGVYMDHPDSRLTTTMIHDMATAVVQSLNQQPAVVDGAMVERLALALAMYEQHRTTMQSLASSVGDFLRDYRALAAQPGEE